MYTKCNKYVVTYEPQGIMAFLLRCQRTNELYTMVSR